MRAQTIELARQVSTRSLFTQAAFAEGDMVLLRESSKTGKSTLIGPLTPEGQYGTTKGIIPHASIIGKLPRTRIKAETKLGYNGQYIVQFPTLADYVLLCTRQRTPIYPKDASAIVSMLDISNGDRILEAGTGNAGLTMYLARAVGQSGKVFTVERNKHILLHAQKLVAQFQRGSLLPSILFYHGDLSNVINEIACSIDTSLTSKLGLTISEGLTTSIGPNELASENTNSEDLWKQYGNLIAPLFDGIVLDMPMPWIQLPRAFVFLKLDRFIVCYLPNISQVMQLVRACLRWPLIVEDVVEVDWRSWDVKTAAVRNPENAAQANEINDAMVCRPTHSPMPHTAFLVKLRKCGST
ncbi:hypothetical protein IWW36_002815 [Coemansia brasiliensis]|uniref:tRNA (adenine(58)-N(1))-methyltransferase catalytic subunit TRM61 n=1 Tax=Coemansia brasiliensis TaxID=2650707 RepID=A0A9W8I8Y2_9FUNG|nr:hypothetical protein IWW36_002815 [Coemansia brasiliensis]